MLIGSLNRDRSRGDRKCGESKEKARGNFGKDPFAVAGDISVTTRSAIFAEKEFVTLCCRQIDFVSGFQGIRSDAGLPGLVECPITRGDSGISRESRPRNSTKLVGRLAGRETPRGEVVRMHS